MKVNARTPTQAKGGEGGGSATIAYNTEKERKGLLCFLFCGVARNTSGKTRCNAMHNDRDKSKKQRKRDKNMTITTVHTNTSLKCALLSY